MKFARLFCSRTALAAGVCLLLPSLSLASSYRMVLQSRDDTAAPFEVYFASFNSFQDMLDGNIGSETGFSQLAVSPDFQIAGLTYDGKYRMTLQTRADSSAPFEVYFASFNSFQDMLDGNIGPETGFSQLAVSPDFQIVGLAYDGKYRLALETREDSNAPFEVYLASFDTYDDMVAANIGPETGYSQLAVSPDFQIVGLTYDGKYRLAVETRVDANAPFEVYFASFDTLSDLFDANIGAETGFSQLGVSPDFRIAGLAYETQAVPEPVSFFALGGGAVGLILRRSKR